MYDGRNCATCLVVDPVASPDGPLPPSTLNTLAAAAHLHDGDVTLMIPTKTGDIRVDSPVVQEAKSLNKAVKRVILANIGDGSDDKGASPLLAENMAEIIKEAQHEVGPFSHFIACANKHSSNYMSR